MGVLHDAIMSVSDRIEQDVFSRDLTSSIVKEHKNVMVGDQAETLDKIQGEIDMAVFNTSVEKLARPATAGEVKPSYRSRVTPGSTETGGIVEIGDEEQFNEADILGRSKRGSLTVGTGSGAGGTGLSV